MTKHYKMLKETEDDANRWEDILYFWIGRISIVKMTVLLKTIYRLSAVPVKLPVALSTELDFSQSLCSQSNVKKENWWWKKQTPRVQTISQSYSHQNGMVLAQTDIQNMTQNSEIKPCTCGQLICDKWCRNTQWRVENLFSKWCWEV